MNQLQFEADGVPVEKLPKPAGWRLLLAPVKIQQKSSGGIILTDVTKETEEYFRDKAKVVAVGEECYRHPKFQGGIPLDVRTPKPWAKVGDIVQYSSYTGLGIAIQHNGEVHKLRFINDDEVVAVIDDLSVLNFL